MSPQQTPPEVTMRLHDPRIIDRAGRMLQLGGIDEAELGQIVRVMDAMFRWREAEARVSETSRRYMRLGDNDMKALRFAIVMSDKNEHVTARDIAQHLRISSASITKLLDRLEAGGHIRRTPHPTDRRALAIVVDPETRAAAEATVGREHARRFRVAAALGPEEREVVIRFLDQLSITSEGEWGEPFAHAADADASATPDADPGASTEPTDAAER
jgi:DNA-binding MarR family transcriptional regulator